MKKALLAFLSGAWILGGLPCDADAAFINYAAREINCKIVYYGSATAGLHDNLVYIYGKTNPESRGKMIALKTETDNVEFFDFLPLNLGEIRGFKVRFHLYTVPGNSAYDTSRVLILKGVDGVVFVADSDPARLNETLASWKSLKKNLAQDGFDWRTIPLVVQLDHRDRPDAMSVEQLKQALGITTQPTFEAVVPTGVGVFATLKGIARLILIALRDGAAAR